MEMSFATLCLGSMFCRIWDAGKCGLESDDERIIDRTLGLLRMPTVLDSRSDVIVGLVREARDASENWKARLRGLIGGRHGYTSPEMRDLVVELVGDGTLDQVSPGD